MYELKLTKKGVFVVTVDVEDRYGYEHEHAEEFACDSNLVGLLQTWEAAGCCYRDEHFFELMGEVGIDSEGPVTDLLDGGYMWDEFLGDLLKLVNERIAEREAAKAEESSTATQPKASEKPCESRVINGTELLQQAVIAGDLCTAFWLGSKWSRAGLPDPSGDVCETYGHAVTDVLTQNVWKRESSRDEAIARLDCYIADFIKTEDRDNYHDPACYDEQLSAMRSLATFLRTVDLEGGSEDV